MEIAERIPLSAYKEFVTVYEGDFEFMKESAFDDAVNELVDNGYIVIKREYHCWDNYKQKHFTKCHLGRLKE